MADTHVVALVGSLREGSYTRLATARALEGVDAAGGHGELLDLREYDLPPLNTDRDEPGDSQRLVDRVGAADAIILASPMYHGSYSGVLKNALDYCGFDEFEGKTVGLLAVSGGSFPITTLEHLRSVCRALDSWVLPHQAAIPNVHSAFENGAFVDEETEARVDTLGRRVVEYADIESEPPTFESDQNEGADD